MISWAPAAFASAFLIGAASAAPPAKTPVPANPPSATPAQAAPKPALPPLPDPAKDDPAKVAAAREFIVTYHPQMNPLNVSVRIEKMMPMMIAQATQNDPKLDVKKFVKEKRDNLMRTAAKILDRQAHVVSRHFTLPELKGLIAFFHGPLGSKLTAETPKIQAELRMENQRARMARMAAQVKADAANSKDNDDEDDDDDDGSSNKSLTHPPKPKK